MIILKFQILFWYHTVLRI